MMRENALSGLSTGQIERALGSVPCGLCIYRYDGEKLSPLFHNPAFYALMGYSQEHIRELERETRFLGVHPEDMPQLKEKLGQAMEADGVIDHTYRLWNDTRQTYCWIRMEGAVTSQEDGSKLIHAVYSDVSRQLHTEEELKQANKKMQDIVNSIPGGVAIYKVSDIFETVYFSDGVPGLSGYTVEEYKELVRQDAAEMTYWEDTPMVVGHAREVIRTRRPAAFEFRKQHRDGHIVWVRVQITYAGEDEGCPLLHCVFHNISQLKEAQLEMDHLVNSIPGGIASYLVKEGRFAPTFYSEGLAALSGYTREEYDKVIGGNAVNAVYEGDRERVLAAVQDVLTSGQALDISYRTRHKDGSLIWINMTGRRMETTAGAVRFYAVFTGLSAETRLFQSIVNETADGIYVIGRENYDLLYSSENRALFPGGKGRVGQKCYAALHGRSEPCEHCTLRTHPADGKPHEFALEGGTRIYSTRFREADWNGIPVYVKYVQDVTGEIRARNEKKRLEQYFQTMIKYLPGGVAVIRWGGESESAPEFLSEGFAAMTDMTLEEAWEIYRKDAMAGIHPDDLERVKAEMSAYMKNGEKNTELMYRLRKGKDSYVWVKNTLTLIEEEDGEKRVYAIYQDMTRELEERAQLRQQYNELLLRHYRAPGPDALIVGHCNITRNKLIELMDYTHSGLLEAFGIDREQFFTGMGTLVVEEAARKEFYETYLNAPSLQAYAQGRTELVQTCFLHLPREERGRYAQISVNLVEDPDTKEVTGILTVTDVTEKTLSARLMGQLSVASYDLVADVDLVKDRYTVLSGRAHNNMPGDRGCHSDHIQRLIQHEMLPKDRGHASAMFDPAYMARRLQREGAYSFSYSVMGEDGGIQTKKMTVSATDLRLGRVCLARTDITDSVREQQGLLSVIAYTFELLVLIDVHSKRLTMYSRRMLLENLPPHVAEDYTSAMDRLAGFCGEGAESAQHMLAFDVVLAQLKNKPGGYDFVLPYQEEDGLRYKQINVLWGDRSHKTVCMVRADVTDMLAAERQRKGELEKALALAEEANRAKSDFLSSMSHDIRTPMNAIMGMTALAVAHQDQPERVRDCLNKISMSSKHLLSLINDILDMSKIERAKISLNRMPMFLPDLVEQLSAMMTPQARAGGLRFDVRMEEVVHRNFYGDALRVNQILINILGNAVKFTPEGGSVDMLVEELAPEAGPKRARYRFTIRDTGVGMTQEFMDTLFEPFTRGRAAAYVEGSGLGLSITKGLVDMMGGCITAESQLRKGTTFRVELEFDIAGEDAGQVGESTPSREGPALTGRRFLVAEDNRINAEILCELLQMQGAKVVLKTDGAQAVRAFQNASPGTYDAILMDIQMPVMSGHEATRAIRAIDRPDARTIPILAMTANAFAEDVQASIDAGMDAHVAKPIDVNVLWATLGQLLK